MFMSPAKYTRIALGLSAFLLTTTLSAQDGVKRAPVQEDPILRSIDRTKPAYEALTLPSDPDRVKDQKVQEDPLVSGLSEEPRKTTQTETDREPEPQADKTATIDSAVSRDPILETDTGQEVGSATAKDRKQPPKRSERKQRKAEPESEHDPRLVPKPKGTSVQEDPLLRSIDPRG